MVAFIIVFQHANIVAYSQQIPLTINIKNINAPVVAKINRTDSLEIDSLLKKGNLLQWKSPDSAMYSFNVALQKSLYHNYNYGSAIALINMGKTEVGRGRFNESMQMYERSYPYILQSPKKELLISTLYINIGATYSFQDKYENAFQYYYAILQFLTQQKELNNYNPNLIIVYNNIGDVLLHMEQYDKASYYLNLGEQLMLDNKQKEAYGYIWVNKANIALKKKDYKAYEYYKQQTLQVAQQYNQLDVLQSVYLTEGEYYMNNEAPEKAIQSFKKAVNTNLPIYSYYAEVIPHYNLGFAYYQIKDFVKAERTLLLALEKSNSIRVNADRLKALSILAAIYEKTNRLQKALAYQKSYSLLKDSIQNNEKLSIASELEVKFRTAEKDKELANRKLKIEQQNRDLERKNVLMIGAIVGLILIVFLFIILYRNFRIRNKVIALKAKIEGEEEERARIARELHDGLGGILAVLKMKFSSQTNKTNQDQTIVKLLNQTADEIRKTAHNLMPDSINNLSIEEALTTYIEMINRTDGNLIIELQIQTQITQTNASSKLSLYRILQELLQNIVKHSQASFAVIQIFKQNNKLHILVEDNGIGFDFSNAKKGLGLTNLETRIKILNGKILFHSTPGRGTTINIELS